MHIKLNFGRILGFNTLLHYLICMFCTCSLTKGYMRAWHACYTLHKYALSTCIIKKYRNNMKKIK